MAQHSVTLNWSWAQGTGDPAQGFHIQRSGTSGGPYAIVGTTSNFATPSFVDNSVVGGQTFFYVVTAFNAAGDSAPSNQFTAVVPFSVPSAPTALSGTVV